MKLREAHIRGNSRALHLVEQTADLAEVGDDATIRVECTLTAGTLWERIDQDFHRTTRVDLEGELACHGVLPEL
jgi:hypothetical protein